MRGLYKIINKINGKFYIGSSDNIKRRFNRHLYDLKKNKHDNIHLQNAWNKYGKENFEFQFLRQVSSLSLLFEEQKELNIWVGKEECYNIRKDATCPVAVGEHRSDEIKQKISLAQKGKPKWTLEQRKQMSLDRKGRKHTKETIKKFFGRKHSVETRHKIKIYQQNRPKKIPLTEYETIKSLYLSGDINKRQLAFKYNVSPTLMGRILKRTGI
jgi:group I intron endonuclease